MKPLANDYVEIYKSPDPKNAYSGTPAICILRSGRYVFSHDLFTNNDASVCPEGLPKEVIPHPDSGLYHIGQIFTSDDSGKTWQKKALRNFFHARPFECNGYVYLLGHCDDLIIYRSDDNGETWDMGSYLTKGKFWQSSAANVWIEDGYISLAVEKVYNDENEIKDGWNVSSHAPVVMRAKITDDLRDPKSWSFSKSLRFRDLIKEDELDLYGVPFFTTTLHKNDYNDGRTTDNMSGWLECVIVKIKDEKHYWYDESGKTFHLIMRAHTSGTGYVCILKAVITEKNGKEEIEVMPEINPSGKRIVYLPLPGGQLRFHILWDEKTKLFWLLSSQATDSMTRKEFLSENRFNLPYDERHRMQLSFSKNLVDWCFAGIVAIGKSEKESRHYASMAIDGEDIVFVSRSGSENTCSAHNADMATFHRIKNFRKLVY